MRRLIHWGLIVVFMSTGNLYAQPGIIFQTIDLDTISKKTIEAIKAHSRPDYEYIFNLGPKANLDNLRNLEGLEFISLRIDLDSVPESFSSLDLSACKSLNLVGSASLKDIQNLKAFSKLQRLVLRQYYGTKLPAEFGQLKHLHHLYLAQIPHLQEASPLASLKKLRSLTMREVPELKQIPDLTSLTELAQLDLDLNDACKMSANCFPSGLEQITIGGSSLSAFPDNNFSKLKKVNLYHCLGLNSIAGLAHSTGLERIKISQTGLKVFDGDFKNVRLLSLEVVENVQLSILSALSTFSSIEKVVLRGSPLIRDLGTTKWTMWCEQLYLHNLPKLEDLSPITGLRGLKKMGTSRTAIQSFPMDFINFQSLITLDVYDNPFFA